MSIHVMNLVWRNANYQGNTLLALLALADWCNDDGQCWPAVETIAKKSRQSERNTQKVLAMLVEDKILSVTERPGTSSLYTINLEVLGGCKGFTPKKTARGGDRRGAKSGALFAPNTSIEPSGLETTTTVESDGPLQRIWNYYVKEMGKPFSAFTDKRRKMAKKCYEYALKLNHGNAEKAEEFMQIAINQLSMDDFHNARGEYKGKKKFNDFDYAFRSVEKFEYWLNRSNGE